MQRLEVGGAVRPLKWSLGVKWLTKFQMAPAPSTLISSGFRKKEPRCMCRS